MIDGADVLADPAGMLRALCDALGIPFDDAMLSWPAGRRDSDGVWAPAWYEAVERSTGFVAPEPRPPAPLPDALARIADAGAPALRGAGGVPLAFRGLSRTLYREHLRSILTMSAESRFRYRVFDHGDGDRSRLTGFMSGRAW